MAERKDILESALDAGFTVIDAATIGLVKRSDEAEMCDFALKYNVTQNDLCNTALDIPLKTCSRQFTIDDIYEFDVQTIEDDQTMYRAGYYTLSSPNNRAIPITASELVDDIKTDNASNYSQITGGRAVAVRPGGIQITHTGQIACHVFMVAAGLISGVKDVTGTELTAITQTFTNVSMSISGAPNVATWDIYLINRIITPGTYSYSMF